MKSYIYSLYSLFLFVLSITVLPIQAQPGDFPAYHAQRTDSFQHVHIAFYNLDQLYDAKDDPVKVDQDFLPNGKFNWTETKYQQKLTRISEVIASMNHAEGPDILGVSQIENESVIKDLINSPALAPHKYQFVHRASQGLNGLDIALIYKADQFEFESYEGFSDILGATAFDFLRVTGKINQERVHFMVCHWPEGKNTEMLRSHAAKLTRKIVDRIFDEAWDSNLILLGEWNAAPSERNMYNVLQSLNAPTSVSNGQFYNPAAAREGIQGLGSAVIKKKWNFNEQILISHSLLLDNQPIRMEVGSFQVFKPQYLLNKKGFPTPALSKKTYNPQGASSHLPIYFSLKIKTPVPDPVILARKSN